MTAATPAELFTEHRSLLFTVAYEITGSVQDAEDVVQDSYLRWAPLDMAVIENPRAYLVRIVTRQALNKLRAATRRREQYVGPWLPEPLLTTPDVAEDAVLADSVSMAMMVVLETLSPSERAVFVLHEVFGYSHPEIAEMLDRPAASVRQLAHRAREHVQARRPAVPADARADEHVLHQFLTATTTGDLSGLLAVLAPQVVLLTDGGGKKSAARRPLHGAGDVARFLIGVAGKFETSRIGLQPTVVNGMPACLVSLDGELDQVALVQFTGGLISGVYLVRNPDKLQRVGPPTALRRS